MKIILLLLLLCSCLFSQAQVSGIVEGSSGNPIEGVEVRVEKLDSFIFSDKEGKFTLPFSEWPGEIVFIYFNNQDTIYTDEIQATEIPHFLFGASVLHLPEVQFTAHKEREEISIMDAEEIRSRTNQSLSEALKYLPGINAVQIGISASKPIIHGSVGKRVSIIEDQTPLSSQQWGADHGVEIDVNNVEQLSIIRGAQTLKYNGYSQLGLINISSYSSMQKNDIKGEASLSYHSSNQLLSGGISLGKRWDKLNIQTQASIKDYGDYHIPSESFTYRGYVFPIIDKTLKNTAGTEYHISQVIGLELKRYTSQIQFSYYSHKSGIFTGAIGIPRSYTLKDDGNARNVHTPYTHVIHLIGNFENTWLIKNKTNSIKKIVGTVNVQKDVRNEYSLPEAHSVQQSQANSNLAISMRLHTLTGQIAYEEKQGSENGFAMGIQSQLLYHNRSGYDYLLPSYRSQRAGLYGIFDRAINSQVTFHAGLRYDMNLVHTSGFVRNIYNSNNDLIDSISAPYQDRMYYGISGVLEVSYRSQLHTQYTLAIGKSYRYPEVVEISSNGLHHGTFRHERGIYSLVGEQGFPIELLYQRQGSRLTFRGLAYFAYIRHYIYLKPSIPAEFSTLPEGGQLYTYASGNIAKYGVDLELHWQSESSFQTDSPLMECSVIGDFVNTINLRTGLSTPFSPTPKIFSSFLLRPLKNNSNSMHLFKKMHLEAGFLYQFPAVGRWRVSQTELTTPGYGVFNFSIGIPFEFMEHAISTEITVFNVFDKNYYNHLSRYRILNIAEPGRNIQLHLSWEF